MADPGVPAFDARLAAWWSHRQGLDGSLRGATAAVVLDRAGWARSVGGVGPYLTLFSRARLDRAEADAAVAALAIHELPAARNCTYVVPAADFGLALRVGQEHEGSERRIAAQLGVTDDELARLADGVLTALDGRVLDPDGIRAATGTLSRSLGEAGKKKGVGTTLPLVLSRLQALGEIRRVPVDGRLDQQRYAYTRWRPNPLAGASGSVAEAYVELARHYFRWVAPATASEFRWFAGLGVRATAAVLAELQLAPMAPGSDRMLLAADAPDFASFERPTEASYELVSSLDAISAARRNVVSLLDPGDLGRTVQLEKQVGTLGGLADLPSHAIVDRGRVVGLWEFDPDEGQIVHLSFVPRSDALDAAIAETTIFVRDQLGDARSFSLDSPRSRRPKLEALRRAE